MNPFISSFCVFLTCMLLSVLADASDYKIYTVDNVSAIFSSQPTLTSEVTKNGKRFRSYNAQDEENINAFIVTYMLDSDKSTNIEDSLKGYIEGLALGSNGKIVSYKYVKNKRPYADYIMKGKYGDIPFTRYGRVMYVNDKFYG